MFGTLRWLAVHRGLDQHFHRYERASLLRLPKCSDQDFRIEAGREICPNPMVESVGSAQTNPLDPISTTGTPGITSPRHAMIVVISWSLQV